MLRRSVWPPDTYRAKYHRVGMLGLVTGGHKSANKATSLSHLYGLRAFRVASRAGTNVTRTTGEKISSLVSAIMINADIGNQN